MGKHRQGLRAVVPCRPAAPLNLGANGVMSFSDKGKGQDISGCMLHERKSHIDDILVRADTSLDRTLPKDVLLTGERSDQFPLRVSFPLQMSSASQSGTVPPREDKESINGHNPKAFCRPMTPGQKKMPRCHLEGIMMNDIVWVADDILAAYAERKSSYPDTICCHEPG